MSTVSRSGLTEIPLFGPCSNINPKGITPPLKKREVTLFAPFNGISGARLALERAGLIVKKHFISEINKYANEITMRHYPDSIQMGDIIKWREWDLYDMSFGIDFMIFGSPYQDLSIAKANRTGLKGSRSGLFWDVLEMLRILNPTYWIMENVNSMSDEDVNVISAELGYFPRRINSSLVSGQSRERLYWTDFKVKEVIQDRGIFLESLLEAPEDVNEKCYADRTKSYCIDASYSKGHNGLVSYFEKSKRQVVFQSIKVGNVGDKDSQGSCVYSVKGKSISISANGGGMGAKTGLYRVDLPDGKYTVRMLTPIECERVQTFPDRWTEGVCKTQRLRCLGNAFTVAAIQEVVESIPFEFE